MKTIYLDCSMGAAGDMLSAALYELLGDKEKKMFINRMNRAGIPGVGFIPELSVKCGINGTHMKVTVDGAEEGGYGHHEHEHGDGHHHEEHHHGHGHGEEHCHDDHDHEHHGHGHGEEHCHDDHDHEHHGHGHGEEHHCHDHHEHEHGDGHHEHVHRSMHDIEHIISGLDLPDRVKKDAVSVYRLIADAESAAHGRPVEEIHFHEVGTMDAIADITAVSYLISLTGADKIIASAVNTGSGEVHCAHGILPVPAPATAYLLKEIPMYQGNIRTELCTPTGAALLKYFVSEFSDMPVMRTCAVGYGMGKKDFERANCLRAFLGESDGERETVTVLSFNVDDMTPEAIGYASEILLGEGAREVYTVAAGMKKSRPGTEVNVICSNDDRDKIIRLIFKHTSTIGIRESVSARYTLERRVETVDTVFGPVRRKISEGYGVKKSKWEYDDVARIASKRGESIEHITEMLDEGR